MQCKEVEVVLEQEGWTPLPEAARDHLAGCSACQNLVEDLTAIVATAHLLPAEVEPPARVWTSLRAQLEKEGIIKLGDRRARFLAGTAFRICSEPGRWLPPPWDCWSSPPLPCKSSIRRPPPKRAMFMTTPPRS